jgi:hypothetical protein
MLATARPALALWAKQFGVSDMQYRVWVESGDKHNTTYGFYLTSFPCYAQNSSEYFKTQTGGNILTLYCLAPPENITLGYVTRPNGAFVPKNAKLDGYMVCPVSIAGLGKGDVKPRLAVNIDKCPRKSIKGSENQSLIKTGAKFEGKTVGEAMSPQENDKAKTTAQPAQAPAAPAARPQEPADGAAPARRPAESYDDPGYQAEDERHGQPDDIEPEDLEYDFETESLDTEY